MIWHNWLIYCRRLMWSYWVSAVVFHSWEPWQLWGWPFWKMIHQMDSFVFHSLRYLSSIICGHCSFLTDFLVIDIYIYFPYYNDSSWDCSTYQSLKSDWCSYNFQDSEQILEWYLSIRKKNTHKKHSLFLWQITKF